MCTVLLPTGVNPIAVKYIILQYIYIYICIWISSYLISLVYLVCVLGKVAPGHVYLPSRQVSPVSIIPPLFHTLIFLPSTYVMLPINYIFKPHLFVTSGRWKRDLFSSSKHYDRYVRLHIVCIQITCHEENCFELPSFGNAYIWSDRKGGLGVIYTVSSATPKGYGYIYIYNKCHLLYSSLNAMRSNKTK
jgi:hypothetical protein